MSEQPITSYRDLSVWQQAMTLAEACYGLTRSFPRDELFGMTSQIRRSAASIAANIAEGHGREATGSFIQHLRIAQGSLKELETHLLLASRVGITTTAKAGPALDQCQSIGKMLRALIRSLEGKKS
ncbi:MAG: four helix bundle protein [Rhizomicrobium sp.]